MSETMVTSITASVEFEEPIPLEDAKETLCEAVCDDTATFTWHTSIEDE